MTLTQRASSPGSGGSGAAPPGQSARGGGRSSRRRYTLSRHTSIKATRKRAPLATGRGRSQAAALMKESSKSTDSRRASQGATAGAAHQYKTPQEGREGQRHAEA